MHIYTLFATQRITHASHPSDNIHIHQMAIWFNSPRYGPFSPGNLRLALQMVNSRLGHLEKFVKIDGWIDGLSSFIAIIRIHSCHIAFISSYSRFVVLVENLA